ATAEPGDELSLAGLDRGALHVDRLVRALGEDVMTDVVGPGSGPTAHLDHVDATIPLLHVLLEGLEPEKPRVRILAEPLGVAGRRGSLAPPGRPCVTPGVERQLIRLTRGGSHDARRTIERVEERIDGAL